MTSDQLKKKYYSFVVTNLIGAGLLLTGWYLLHRYSAIPITSKVTPWIIIFFLATNLTVFYFQLQTISRKLSRFVNVFLITTTLKLLLFLVIIITYAFLFREDAVNFILNFFVIYVVFTSIEVARIISAQKKLKNNTLQN